MLIPAPIPKLRKSSPFGTPAPAGPPAFIAETLVPPFAASINGFPFKSC
jgi:hypothetical protein